jgi:sucrose 6(F)-phosphate phosphorylase
MAVINKVQLITYPDSLGGDLKTLNQVLRKHFIDIFEGGIHILPPFPSSGDRGFAPLTYLEIEPAFGSWEDIRAIGENFDILLDLMVNHISKQSTYFQDFLTNGRDSEFADLFITLDKIWPDGKPVKDDVDKMFLRREEPYSTFRMGKAFEEIKVWTTFGKQVPSEQIDLDINSALTKKLLTDFMVNFSKQGVKIVRLDAVGYVIKKLGTSCFFVEPEIHRFMDWITDLANSLNIELLPEVHSHYSIQYKLAEKGHWIYDFILPYYILEALIHRSAKKLCEYLRVRPHKQFTMLDCHDGIPVKPDLDGLVSSADARKIVDVCMERGSNLSLIFSDKHKSEDGFDVHQIRCSFYSALDCDDDAYLAARAIQFFAPGIPQVYYVGLLAGKNDTENVLKTGEGREINRHNFTAGEIDEAVNKPVVQRLMNLIRFRNQYPAFNGVFSVSETQADMIVLSWEKDDSFCVLKVDMNTFATHISYLNKEGSVIELKV